MGQWADDGGAKSKVIKIHGMRQLIAVADFDSVKLVFQYFEAS
tara:strand:+ start:741 stop:869 length:129 start_codon:yes stop_codon:yes gene_type:complete